MREKKSFLLYSDLKNIVDKLPDETKGKLVAHHIKPFAKFPELRVELSNGITSCKKCHIQEHKKSA